MRVMIVTSRISNPSSYSLGSDNAGEYLRLWYAVHVAWTIPPDSLDPRWGWPLLHATPKSPDGFNPTKHTWPTMYSGRPSVWDHNTYKLELLGGVYL